MDAHMHMGKSVDIRLDRRVAARTERDVVRLCHRALDARRLRVEALRLLRRAIPIEAAWFATADPATLLFTSSVVDEIPERVTPAFVANEFLGEDVNKWVRLARARRPVNALYAATRGRPEESPRYREILAPLGMGDELRAVLRDGASSWGFMCLHRERTSAAFTPAEAALLARLTPHLAEGLRAALLIEQVAVHGDGDADATLDIDMVPESAGPGLLLLADDLSLVASTPAAERWLAEMADWPSRRELPQVVYGVAARLRALECDADAQDVAASASVSTTVALPMPRARVRTRAGRWLVLHASRLSGPNDDGRIAIILEPAQPAEVAPLLLYAYDLTPREGQIAQLVLQGHATDEIADELCISALTVQQHLNQQHLKAIFDKTGVRSRRELVAQIFAQHYLRRLHTHTHSHTDPDAG